MTNPSALYLPGTTGNYVSTPNNASLNATDLSGIAHVALDDWTPAIAHFILGRGTSIEFSVVVTTGVLNLLVANAFNFTSSAAPTVSDGEDLWLGFTLDGDNGSSDSEVKFWTSSDGSSWSQLGSTINRGSTTTLAPSGELAVGARAGTGLGPVAGNIHYAAWYTGIGANTAPGQGTLVAEFRADAPIEPRYRDSTGKIWTLNGSAYSFVEVS